MMDIQLTLNGVAREITCMPGETLFTVLRREGCFSVRYGSGTGETGSAAVLVDGRLVAADVLLAAQADGHEVTTVEQLNVATGELHPIQAAFKEEHGLQCGFCTPGMMLVGSALIAENPDPTDDDVRWAISGQICRCTGYMNIVKAIQAAAKAKASASAPANA